MILRMSATHRAHIQQKMNQTIHFLKERYGFTNQCVLDESESCGEEITYEEAMNGAKKETWTQAMMEELKAFEDNQAWELVDVKKADRVVQCK
jgi:hypothetical protein